MKLISNIKLICMIVCLIMSGLAHAQAPQAFSYQAVARDVNGNLLSNQNVALRFSILEGSSSGTHLYQEKHTLSSNQLGLCNVNIGQGTVLSGTFSAINWGSGSKYIKVELDPSGGNTFTVMGTTQLLSVPYAMYANVPGVAGPQGIQGTNGKTILNGTVNPLSTQGVDGDFYLNTVSKQLFGPKTAGAWGSGTSLVGPQGAQGAQGLQGIQGPQGIAGTNGTNGTNGVNGKTILNGTVNPLNTQGVDGDFYLNTVSKQLFGPKTAGAWGSGTSLVGPQGAQGAQGLQGIQGPQGIAGVNGTNGINGTNGSNGADGKTILNGINNPQSADGTDGDFYLNTSTYEIFGPKTAGVWGTGTSLIGAAGGMNNGTAVGNTTFWNGSNWVLNDNFLFNDGTQIGIGNPVPAASSIVDITSSSKGFLIPRLSTAERDAIISPVVGLQVYNVDDHCIDIYDGTVWTKTCGLKSTGTVSDPNHALPDTWAPKTGMPSGRSNAIAFTIGDKAYVGLGTSMGMTYFDDFYEYNPVTDTWTQKANFPPGARADAVAFSINGKGYVTMGGNGVFVNYDMWEYDPVADTWTLKSNCPGSARTKAQGFAIGAKAYIGLGNDGTNDLSDFWEYDPATDTWTQKTTYPGLGRTHTLGLSVNNLGYIGLGTDNNGNYYGDLWEYDANSNSWTAKQSFAGSGFHSMSCFTMNGKGYVGTGYNGLNELTDFWEYDAALDTWTAKAAYSGSARRNGVGFSIGNKGYIAAGNTALVPMMDVWEYMDNNVTGNAYTNTSINTNNNSMNDGAWTVYNNNVHSSVSGNVGIGTSTPTSKLSVNGNVDVSGELLANGVPGLAGQVLASNGNGTMSWITNVGGGGGSSPWTTVGNDISNTNGGNVGIGGMPSSDVKLDVSGNGRFTGDLISGISHKGCITTLSTSGLFTQTIYQLTLDGQNIQGSGGLNAFPYNPGARNIYLNPLGGNIGIRTNAANATLTVARGTGGDGTAAFIGTNHVSHFNYSTAEDTYIRGGKNGSKVFINDGALGPVVIGNVSSYPAGYKLFVDDGILTERLKVAVNGSANWADYVFADDYKLMPLEEVEAFVKEHNHLPNVPSADDMVETGIDVATVDAKLMEKIEELTLYLIEMKKEMKKLSDENARIQSQLKTK